MNRATKRAPRFRPLDWLFLLYGVPTGLLLLAAGIGTPSRAGLLAVHGILLLLPFILGRLHPREGFWPRFLSIVYPCFFVLLFYREVEILNQLFFSGYRDQEIQALEQTLGLGDLREHLYGWFPSPWVETLLNAGYFSYYFFLPLGGIPLALASRWDELEEFIFICFLTYSACFAIYIVYPVVGPFFDFHPVGSYDGKDWMSRLTYTLVNDWGARGAAFPSSHVAIAVIVAVLARRYRLTTFWLLAPFAVALTSATVYGSYHYPIDALVGILFAVAMLPLAPRLRGFLQRLSGQSASPSVPH